MTAIPGVAPRGERAEQTAISVSLRLERRKERKSFVYTEREKNATKKGLFGKEVFFFWLSMGSLFCWFLFQEKTKKKNVRKGKWVVLLFVSSRHNMNESETVKRRNENA